MDRVHREAVPVRIGTPADFAPMMALLCEMHRENGVAPMDEALVMATLRRGLARDRACVGIAERDGAVAGSVGLFVGRWWYSQSYHIEDFWNFVHPDHRRSTTADGLIRFAKDAAAQLGLPLLMGVLSNARTEAKVQLYSRKLPIAGALYLYQPETERHV